MVRDSMCPNLRGSLTKIHWSHWDTKNQRIRETFLDVLDNPLLPVRKSLKGNSGTSFSNHSYCTS